LPFSRTATTVQRLYACALFAEGLNFKSRAGQILYSVAKGSPPNQYMDVIICVAIELQYRALNVMKMGFR